MKTAIDGIVDLDRREPPAGPMTYEEFLDWADDKTFAEWVDGEVVLMSPVTDDHDQIAGFLYTLLRWWCEETGAGRAYASPFQMRLSDIGRGREPDTMVLLTANADRKKDTYIDGAADLAVEVVSLESKVRDRGAKHGEYEMSGVSEYWIIDPLTNRADLFTLVDGGYERMRPVGTVYESIVLPGFKLDITWLWKRPMPKLSEIMRLLGP
jgi:Uma2 family endonuclease